MHKIAVFVGAMALAVAAWGAPSPGQKCEASKNQEAGKYASCLHKAEAKLLKTKGACSVSSATVCYGDGDCPMGETCAKDLTKYGEAVAKCEGKFEATWNKLTQQAIDKGDACPDGLLEADVKSVVDDCVANVAGGLAGDGLTDCGGDLAQCSGDLGACNTDLGTCNGSLTTCTTDLATAQADLTTCEGDLAVAEACGNGTIDAGEQCDQSDLNGSSCVDEGFGAGTLSCGADCAYDTSGCYAARFVDNGDGTITDNGSGLMWEKKVKLDATTELANLQDADNVYRWSGTCSVATSKRCQPDAASEAACLAGVEGDPTGCSQCTGGEGTCAATPYGTIWQWIAALNTANYGGHNDWRVPMRLELEGILALADMTPPAVNGAFQGESCGAACTDVTDPACSCTRSLIYWSASSYSVGGSVSAWSVAFDAGGVISSGKTSFNSVRAVRGGS